DRQIDRTIAKEPAYRTSDPRYGLLVFGPDGKDRVWLVSDGDVLYVDRNGSGDLTDPADKVAAEARPGVDPEVMGRTFEVGDIKIGGRVHKNLRVVSMSLGLLAVVDSRHDLKPILAADPKAMAMILRIDVQLPRRIGAADRVTFDVGHYDAAGALV